ncbi:hypothetical protein BGX26_013002 [Mortierella sp. AD094]|nr:hypothetical protein BGX26_013002 [Mortierella sp. AD094]
MTRMLKTASDGYSVHLAPTSSFTREVIKRRFDDDETIVEQGSRLIPRVRLRSTGSPSLSSSSTIVPSMAGASKSAPSAIARHYASLSQRTTWLEEEEDVGFAFEEYSGKRKSSLDLSGDGIIDLTANSPFLEH